MPEQRRRRKRRAPAYRAISPHLFKIGRAIFTARLKCEQMLGDKLYESEWEKIREAHAAVHGLVDDLTMVFERVQSVCV